jgi:hypothetical protein
MRLAGGLFALAVLAASAAKADQMEDVAQIVCMPEAGYFSLDIRKVDNVDINAVNAGLRFERSALVWPDALRKSYTCNLKGHEVRATAVQWNAHAGDCLPKAGMSIAVAYDNKTVACLDDNEEIEDRRQSLTLTLNWGRQEVGALLEHCTAPLDNINADIERLAMQGSLHCKTLVLGAKTQGKKT